MRKTKKLLSVLIAAVMVVCMLTPVSVFADTSVAKIGDVDYPSLEAAVNAAKNGDTIVLLDDITYGTDHSVAVWGKEFDLDLNRHTFTTNSEVGKSLGNMGYTASAICYSIGTGSRTISVSNGTIRTAYGAGIYVDDPGLTMRLSELDVKQNYPTNVQDTDEYSSAIRLTSNATVIVEDGSYEGKNAIAVSNSGGNVTVNGGTFKGDIFFSTGGTTANKSITINGGNFTGNFVNTNKGTLTITGGTFSADPTAYVAEGCKAVKNADNTWTVKSKYDAQIGETKYITLADAVAAVNADTSSEAITITLLSDIDFSTEDYADYKWAGLTYAPLEIKRSNVTLDLAGYTISKMGNVALVFGNILAANGGIENITVKNGTLLAGKTDNVTNSYVLGIAGVDGALIKDITTIGGINVYTESKNVVIDSCNVTGTKYYTVCAQSGSDVTIKGTAYTKNTDNTVANKSMFWVAKAGEDSDVATPANPTGAFGASSITIESGNFTVDFTQNGAFYLSSYLKPVVKGGTFNFDPTAYVAEGYTVTDNGDGTYSVSGPYAAKIGNVGYATLKDAIDAASADDTIDMLADANINTGSSSSSRFAISKSMTINGNGHTVTINNRGFGVGMGASDLIDVTFKNVTINNTSNAGRCIDTRGHINSLTLDNVTLSTAGNNSGYLQPLTIGGDQATVAEVNITNSTIKTSEDGSKGYAIITFNPVNMTVTGSTIKGWACFYAKSPDGSAGSAGSVFTITDSTLVSKNTNAGTTNAFGTIVVEDGDIEFNFSDCDISIDGSENLQALFTNNEAYPQQYYCPSAVVENVTVNFGEGNNVELKAMGTYAIYATDDATLSISGGTFSAPVPVEYCAPGYIPKDNGDGTYGVDGPYTATIGTDGYDTIEEAIIAADENTTAQINEDTTIGGQEISAGSTVTVNNTETAGEGDNAVTATQITIDDGNTATTAYLVSDGENTKAITDVNVETTGNTAINTDRPVSDFVDVTKVIATAVAADDSLDVANLSSVTLSLSRTEAEASDANDNAVLGNIIATAIADENTAAFEVHPIVTLTDGTNTTSYRASAEDLTGQAFNFTLNLGENFANKIVTIKHYNANGEVIEAWPKAVDEYGNVNLSMTSFSVLTATVNTSTGLFTGHSISLNGYIDLNFYLNLTEDQITDGTGTVVNFTWDKGNASYTLRTSDFVAGQGYKATVRVPAAEMTDDITATVTIDGTEQGETNIYSVRDYCDVILGTDYRNAYEAKYGTEKYNKLADLVNSMLNYGAYAQSAFGVTEANAGGIDPMPYRSTSELLGLIDDAIKAANGGNTADNVSAFAAQFGGSFYSASLIYMSGCTLRIYLTGDNFDVSAHGFDGVKESHFYYKDVTDIAAAQLDTLQTFTVGGQSFKYSALDFVKAIIYNYAEGEPFYNLAAATYWYNQAANAYFGQ